MANQPSKYSKFLIGAASAALVASAVAPVASAADFKDTKGNTHETAIDALSDAGVISGYPDGTFLPNKTLTRSDVVKMLGKWLVNTQGVEVPTDYKTKPRFADQTAKTNDELLKYSAVVKDNGVFNGLENGTLDATADITRENMALVLVRAFDTVNKTDLVSYVAEKEFNKDVTDLAKAKAEARPYIDVLDFFDITNPAAPQFNPKATTTRGQFASFLHKTTSVEVSDINAEVDSIVATNNTTVEVTFKTEIEDIKALDFAIEGLTVSNASVKQTGGNKVVVLTTSAQVGDKEYTVTANGTKLGSFKGVSAVVPSAIKVSERSLQGVIGNQITVAAQVTVADGQSKAGIPVTFNVQNSSTDNKTIEVEAFTNAEGVATYSYTRYYASTDSVNAYATSKSSVFSTGKVYWANSAQLTIKDITEATTLVNGSKKVYEINSVKNAGGYVFVTFAENLNVAPDKAVRTASVEGVTTYTLDANGNATNSGAKFPYEYSTGGKAVTAVKLDANGKANLVVTGSNAKVTPIVFEGTYKTQTLDSNVITEAPVYSATALQAKASTVSFELKHELGLTIKAEGVQNAATYKTTTETGGRDYTVTYTDKDGKVAAPGTTVRVAIDTEEIKGNFRVLNSDGEVVSFITDGTTRIYNVLVEKAGQGSFTVTSTQENDYVAPIAFIDNGKTNSKLDADDLQVAAESTYFVEAVVYSANLKAVDGDGKPVSTIISNGVTPAVFVYELVDQNGKLRSAKDGTTVSFEVKAGTGDLSAAGTLVKAGTTKTIPATINANTGTTATITVTAATPTTATVSASGSRAGVVLPTTSPASVSVNFSQYGTGAITGVVTSINTTLQVLTINNTVYSYENAVEYKVNGNTVTKSAFVADIEAGKTRVSVTVNADGKFTFNSLPADAASSMLTKVNAATTGAQIQTAIASLPEFKALTAADKVTAVGDILTLVQAGTVTEADINGVLSGHLAATFEIDTAGIAYTVASAASTAVKATGTDAGAVDIALTAKATGVALNGYQVTIVDTNQSNSTLKVTAVHGATKTIEIDVANAAGGAITTTVAQVIAALGVQGFDVTTALDVTDFADALVGADVTLASGAAAIAAVKAELSLTFTESVSAKVGDAVSLTLNDGSADFIIAGTVATVANEVVTISITSETPALVSGDDYTLDAFTGLSSFVSTTFTANAVDFNF